MDISDKGLEIIKRHEGLRLKAYKCPGDVWTIGYGSTKGVTAGMVISKAEAEKRLLDDLQDAENGVDALVDVPLNQNQFDALVSFTFNVGRGALQRSTLLRHLNAGRYNAAAKEFDRWNKSAGRVLPGLVKRRSEEKALFLTPVAIPEPSRKRLLPWLQKIFTNRP